MSKFLGLLALMLAMAPAPLFAQAAPSPYTSAVRYDAAGRVTGTISADPDTVGSGNPFIAMRNSYDGAGRLTKVETGTLSTWQSDGVTPGNWGAAFTVSRTLETQYDAVGHKIRDTLREGAAGPIRTITQYSYDNAGRLDCTAVRMNPALFGSLPGSACSLSTPEGSDGPDRITKNVYDAAGQRVQLREGLLTGWEAAPATWAYNLNGQITTMIDANGNRATLHYDGHGRQDSWVFPSATPPGSYNFSTQATALSTAGSANAGDHEDYTYDANNNRLSLRKRDGQMLNFSYDRLNRMTVKDAPGTAADVAYTHDLRNLPLTTLFSASSQGVTNAYDGFGRLVSTTSNMGGIARAVAYQYDRDGNRARVTWPSGFYATYQYDGLDRLTLIQDQGTATLNSFAYDGPGRIVSRSDGASGAAGSASITYDGVSRVNTLTHDLASTPSDVTYTYNRNSASQLGSVARTNDSYAWTAGYAVTRNYTPNGLNQYNTIATVGGSTLTLTHDANGNLTSDGPNTYVYDTENRMVSVTGAHTATLVYDPLGRLFQVTSGANVTQFVYDGDALIAEYSGAGTLLRRFVHGADADADDPLVWYEGVAVQYLHTDHQGSIVAVAGSTGASAATNTYDEYGIPGSSNLGRFQYTGQAWLAELGMYYYKARMYSPTLGRFMQTDPIGYEGGDNLYAYTGDDPVNGTDPSGNADVNRSSTYDSAVLRDAGANFDIPGVLTVFSHGGVRGFGKRTSTGHDYYVYTRAQMLSFINSVPNSRGQPVALLGCNLATLGRAHVIALQRALGRPVIASTTNVFFSRQGDMRIAWAYAKDAHDRPNLSQPGHFEVIGGSWAADYGLNVPDGYQVQAIGYDARSHAYAARIMGSETGSHIRRERYIIGSNVGR